jgi:hypothetical protein
MGFSDAISALFTTAKKDFADIPNSKTTSTRLIALVAFVGMILWFTKGVLTSELYHLIFWAFAVYTVCNTVTKGIQMIGVTMVKVAQLKHAQVAPGVKA